MLFAFAAVVAIKSLVLTQVGSHPLLRPGDQLDGAYYIHLATGVRDGDWALLSSESFMRRPVPPFFVAPLYAYFLAATLAVTGGAFEAARLFQVLLGTAAIGLLAAAAHRWYGVGAAWAAGALATLCGLFTFYEVTFVPAALEPFLTALDLYLITRAIQEPRARWWIAAGAALGLHALNQPNMMFVIAGLCVASLLWMWRSHRATPAEQIWRGRHLLGFALAAAVVISPATIRNWKATGELVLITPYAGLNFLIGNGAGATGTRRAVMGIEPTVSGQWITSSQVVAREVGHEVTTTEASRFFFNGALTWMRDHPWQAATLVLRKVRYTLSAAFLTTSHSYPFFSRDVVSTLTFLAVGPAMLLGLGLCGLVVVPGDRRGRAMLGAYAVLAVLSVAVFFVASRHRLPFQVALTVPAGAMVAWLVTGLRNRDWRRMATVVAAIVLIAAASALPIVNDDGRAEEQVRMGLHELQAGRTVEGEAWIARGLMQHTEPGVVHIRAAQIYDTLGRSDEAVTHWRRAAATSGEAAVYERLGLALAALSRYPDALTAFDEAITRSPGAASGHLNRAIILAALGRNDEARLAAGAALAIQPGFTKAADLLAALK